jgi:hypothetical protein
MTRLEMAQQTLFYLPGALNINGARSAAKPPENEFMALASTPAQQREQR